MTTAGTFVVTVIDPSNPPTGDCSLDTSGRRAGWGQFLLNGLLLLVLLVGRQKRPATLLLLLLSVLAAARPSVAEPMESGFGGTWSLGQTDASRTATTSVQALSRDVLETTDMEGYWHIWEIEPLSSTGNRWGGRISVTGLECMKTGTFEARYSADRIYIRAEDDQGRLCLAVTATSVGTDVRNRSDGEVLRLRGRIRPARQIDRQIRRSAHSKTRRGEFSIGVPDTQLVEQAMFRRWQQSR